MENFHCLNFNKFRDTAPATHPKLRDPTSVFPYNLNYLDTCYTIFISPSDNQDL